MKKFFFAFCLFCSCMGFASAMQEHSIDPQALRQLASALGIASEENIVEATQKRWLRRPDQERWEMAELPADKRLLVLDWAQEQGMFTPWLPSSNSYDVALILGATTQRMEKRLAYLQKLWEQGVRFSKVVWLTGERPLDARVDDRADVCHNETEAAKLIWQEAVGEMRDLPCLFVSVPAKKVMNVLKRPNTEDTIMAWLEIEKEPCKALFVSDQPFCGYQFSIVKADLPSSFSFDVVGQGVEDITHPAAAAIILDSLARWIYQDNIIIDKK